MSSFDLFFKTGDEPIRAEIFSVPRLEEHAISLAHAQTVYENYIGGNRLYHRLRENRTVLEQSYQVLLSAAEEKKAVSPAAEWMIDNFHIVRAQLKDIHDHMPKRFYQELPKMNSGHLKGLPRVYGIAWAFVAHTDSRFDSDLLLTFLNAYQTVTPLTIGELWALPITLRVVMLENLRRLSVHIVGSQLSRKNADEIADTLFGLGEDASATPLSDDELVSRAASQPFTKAYAVQLLQRLRFQDSRVDGILKWLDRHLTSMSLRAEDVVTEEHAYQTNANSSVRNIITSSRLMSAFNWSEFFESVSCVDRTLREIPLYGSIDFTTRDRYRHAIEELSKRSKVSELDVARKLVKKTQDVPSDEREPGVYLIGDRRRAFERELNFSPSLRLQILRLYKAFATPGYIGTIGLLTLALAAACVALANSFIDVDLSVPWQLALGFFAMFPASEIAIAIVNRSTVGLIGPQHLPRLDLKNGIPPEMRTFVVVPTMFTRAENIDSQLEELEVHYLSNPEGSVYFALLTDWTDAPNEKLSTDESILQLAELKLNTLNEKHGQTSEGFDRFYILHRRRIFNKGEGKWMGWERKRGKLQEFNRILLGATDTTHQWPGDEPPLLPRAVRYVVTLDADTRMPKGSLVQLVGTMAHPLNVGVYDESKGRVTKGYGILQPRVTPALPGNQDSTIYQHLSTGPAGIDPYASAVSDVYQDLFQEGSFTGKGIYDLALFERALEGRVPENSLLSHDLLEGNFARCGFLSDVEVFEDFPSHVGVATSRSHRWIRGDWQLLPWLLSFSKSSRGFGISVMGRWKMFDNLRRSLVAPFSLLLFTCAFALLSMNAWPFLVLILCSLGISMIVSAVVDLMPQPRANSFWEHLVWTAQDFKLNSGRFGLNLILLPCHAFMSVDAISRALYRVAFSRKHLLEWTTAAQAKASAILQWPAFYKQMRGSVIAAAVALILIGVLQPWALTLTAPFLVLWLAAPYIAYQFSLPPPQRLLRPLRPADIQLLHATARRIWLFFSTFVNEGENWLPPDNFQETPQPIVAHRSSPTNFGLYLLSTLSARDFGWIGISETAERIDQTLRSLDALEKHEGHFYNWYETTDRRPLEPKYISSVDNGNLAGHLLAVAQGCAELIEAPMSNSAFNRGTLDTVYLFEQALNEANQINADACVRLLRTFSELAQGLLTPDHVITNRSQHWTMLATRANQLVTEAGILHDKNPELAQLGLHAWSRALHADIQSSSRDFTLLTEWREFSTEELPEDFPIELQNAWAGIRSSLRVSLSLREVPGHCARLARDVTSLQKGLLTADLRAPDFLESLLQILDASAEGADALIRQIVGNYRLCHKLFNEMNFGLLYDPVRKLFSIGYRVQDRQLDASYYDLLASECRLTSFIAIAKGDVPASHWFRLGRSLTSSGKGSVLVSWSGSMFEYLMPPLVMKSPDGSLLDQTCRLVVDKQIQYGALKGVPWGISESAYNKRDLHLTYQYSNFGLPGLGLKRGLGAELVIAPYATLMATMYDSARATDNLRELQKIGAQGLYGFYEAVDFTPSRLPEGERSAVVKCYMAHHQGMALVALGNVFHDGRMRDRFHSEPLVQATSLLLQERTPRTVGTIKTGDEPVAVELVREDAEPVTRRYHSFNRAIPTSQLLSNGDYTVMLTSAGSGYSRYRDTALTRWREDVTKDDWGTYLYLKDRDNGKIWSATYQPTCTQPDNYEVVFSEDRARFHRVDDGIVSDLEIFVSPEDSAEIRRLKLTNNTDEIREIEITSYSEAVMNTQAADQAHPAFSNLFVQTEFVSDLNAIFASRRPRSEKDSPLWMSHVVLRDRQAIEAVQFETDRFAFQGRNQSVHTPAAIFQSSQLSGTQGPVLDPCLSLRTVVRLIPGATSTVVFANGLASTREDLLMLTEKLADPVNFDRVSGLAWTQAQVKLHYLGIEPDEANLFQRMATRLIYSDSSLRPSTEVLKHARRDVTALWAHGISGDFPMILVRIDDMEDRGIVRQLLKAQEYFATKRLVVDLVVLNEKLSSYSQELQGMLESMTHSGAVAHSLVPQSRGKIFVLRQDLLSAEDIVLLDSEARITLSGRLGSLSDQLKRVRAVAPKALPQPVRASQVPSETAQALATRVAGTLSYFNGLGGFAEDGREYVTILTGTDSTPAPWINVIANSEFGFQVSESGAGYTWSLNSRENQLTPWTNDPVGDPCCEAIYLRDHDSGAVWSPTAAPIRLPQTTYTAHHGQGYSRFKHQAHGIETELTQFVPREGSVKISRLKIKNNSRARRKLAVTGYAEWVLGFARSVMAPTTQTQFDAESQAIFAWNPRHNEHGKRIAFFSMLEKPVCYTADRTEFIGRNRTMQFPAGVMKADALKGHVGAALDPCAAMTSDVVIEGGETVEVVICIGQEADRERARELVARVRKQGAQALLDDVVADWEKKLTKIQVKTPDSSFDLVINRWYLYQTIVCRFWARAAFYQAGGAFGFRDQLQDSLALMHAMPEACRAHLLRAAQRQFIEGDVQHWWHPPFGRGVRTHFSDDLLWLPYVMAHYLKTTGDQSLLDESVPFLEGPLLREDQEDMYYTPNVARSEASMYEHCARTLDKSLKVGVHGLPLMGCGDWNDGMNRVGQHGKGESVWLAWFLCQNLRQFAVIAEARGESERAETWRAHADALKIACEKEAWDGDWYRRAYFDDGTPLGSNSSDECKIDSLAQTWAVISGEADTSRAKHAMEALDRILVKPADEIILLFAPPFDRTPLDPGYIKGYLPGVRENGGQYTHAAAWCVFAMAQLGEGKRTGQLFKLLNPIQHARTLTAAKRYKIEPYVLAGDVYSQAPHTGRGGWSWYTGSSGWMYRAGVESILGFQAQATSFKMQPCITPEWPEFSLTYKNGTSLYEIRVVNRGGHTGGISKVTLNGREVPVSEDYPLVDDGRAHRYEFTIGPVGARAVHEPPAGAPPSPGSNLPTFANPSVTSH